MIHVGYSLPETPRVQVPSREYIDGPQVGRLAPTSDLTETIRYLKDNHEALLSYGHSQPLDQVVSVLAGVYLDPHGLRVSICQGSEQFRTRLGSDALP